MSYIVMVAVTVNDTSNSNEAHDKVAALLETQKALFGANMLAEVCVSEERDNDGQRVYYIADEDDIDNEDPFENDI